MNYRLAMLSGGLFMVTSTSKFIKFVKSECKKHNTVVRLTKWKSMKDDDEYENIYGYFETPGRNRKGLIKVAAGGPRTVWLHTLAHEYAHFEYWRKNKDFRKNYILDEKRTEERALVLLSEWKLPIDIKVRKKQSNKYIKSLQNG